MLTLHKKTQSSIIRSIANGCRSPLQYWSMHCAMAGCSERKLSQLNALSETIGTLGHPHSAISNRHCNRHCYTQLISLRHHATSLHSQPPSGLPSTRCPTRRRLCTGCPRHTRASTADTATGDKSNICCPARQLYLQRLTPLLLLLRRKILSPLLLKPLQHQQAQLLHPAVAATFCNAAHIWPITNPSLQNFHQMSEDSSDWSSD